MGAIWYGDPASHLTLRGFDSLRLHLNLPRAGTRGLLAENGSAM